jgi:glucose/arabinose dehydrogenase
MSKSRIFLLLFALLPFSFPARAELNLKDIKLPPGFSISLYAKVPEARSMTLGDKGTLFVGTRGDKVYAVRERGGRQEVLTIASGLNEPNGVAFKDGALFVAEISRVLRYDKIESRLTNPPAPVVITDKYPKDTHHGWKFIRFGPDGMLYVPIGAPCNICEKPDPYASITRIRPDGGSFVIFARGGRNTVGFDWDPLTKELWFTDNGRDWMGDDKPPDELNRAPKAGMNFGFPYLHGKNIPDPEFGKKKPDRSFTPPEVELGPHVASLGMSFYTGNMFPAEYKNQIFIAEHGSWNRSVPIGYRVTLVRLDAKRKAVAYEVFASGWLKGESAMGRPVDVQVMPDGSMLVSDDKAGAIYRITYKKPGG